MRFSEGQLRLKGTAYRGEDAKGSREVDRRGRTFFCLEGDVEEAIRGTATENPCWLGRKKAALGK